MMSTLNTRRRMLLGGKKEPVYIFKEGEGFKTNPIPGVTLTHSGGSYLSSRITLTPDHDEDGWWRDDTDIGTRSGTTTNVIAWNTAFHGYKKLFVEVANSGSMGSNPLKVGLTSRLEVEDYVPWIQVKSSGSTARQIFEFDISNIANSYILAFGGYYYKVGGSGRISYSYIYNIWLE